MYYSTLFFFNISDETEFGGWWPGMKKDGGDEEEEDLEHYLENRQKQANRMIS